MELTRREFGKLVAGAAVVPVAAVGAVVPVAAGAGTGTLPPLGRDMDSLAHLMLNEFVTAGYTLEVTGLSLPDWAEAMGIRGIILGDDGDFEVVWPGVVT